MSEFYTNTYSSVQIAVRDSDGSLSDPDGTVSVEVFDYDLVDPSTGAVGSVIETGNASQVYYNDVIAQGRFFYELSPSVTNRPRTLRVSWEYSVGGSSRTGSDTVFISVPYVQFNELRDIKDLSAYSDQEIISMERLTAKVIDAYCSQSFGNEVGVSKTVPGDDSDYLWLPNKLTSLDSVKILDDYATDEERDITNYVVLDLDNPWRLRNKRNLEYMPVSEIEDRPFFKNGVIYSVKGDWGYNYVPIEITQAAKILVNYFFCSDSVYRDRYIKDIKAGNWRMVFSATGDSTTGSANADMILSAYRNFNAAVI